MGGYVAELIHEREYMALTACFVVLVQGDRVGRQALTTWAESMSGSVLADSFESANVHSQSTWETMQR